MSPENRTREWVREFESFLRSGEVLPSRSTTEMILTSVKRDLEPSMKRVAAKLFALHAVSFGLVLLVCPQLGIGPLFGGHGLMHFFMGLGPLPCAALCGGLLLSVSSTLITLCLRKNELRVANRHRALNVTLLVSVAFAILMLLGGESDQLSYAFWILGALVAGWFTLRLGVSIRFGRSYPV